MKVKVEWTVEAFETYEVEIDIPDDEIAEAMEPGALLPDPDVVKDYIDDRIEDLLPGEETKDNEQSSTVEERYVNDVTILN